MAHVGAAPREPRRHLAWSVGAASGGFGASIAAWLIGEPVAWAVAGLALGAAFRGSLLAAYGGSMVGAVILGALSGALDAGPPHENAGLDSLGVDAAIFGLFWLNAVTMIIGARLAPAWPSRRGFAAAGGLAGIPAVVAVVGTTLTLAAVPAGRSFELSVPNGWTVLGPNRPDAVRQPAFGDDYAAILGASERPRWDEPAAVPLIGVSVSGVDVPPDDCIRALRGWPGIDSPIFNGPLIRYGDVELPAGTAYEELRAAEPAGATAHAYALTRTRHVGILNESLCYVIVVNLPPDSPVTEAVAEAIVRSFAFK